MIMSLSLALGVAAQAAGGSATLSWTPVKKDTRGRPLKNIVGYKIHYGTSPRALNSLIVLKNPHQTTYVLKGLHSGTWYFRVGAYTSSGAEGVLSDVASKTVK